jgi:chromosome segregation ATPase
MTRDEMQKAIAVLTSEIRTLSYSSTKEAAEKILHLQQRRRELRAQVEAAESGNPGIRESGNSHKRYRCDRFLHVLCINPYMREGQH